MQKIAKRENGVWSVLTSFGVVYFKDLGDVCRFLTKK